MSVIPAGYRCILAERTKAYLVRVGADIISDPFTETWQWDSVSEALFGPLPLQVWLKYVYSAIPYFGNGSDIEAYYDAWIERETALAEA